MGEDKLKLPRSSYEELCRIIMAYGRGAKASNLDEVSQRSGVAPTVISANNAFLSGIGVIEGGKAKAATALGSELARAIEHDLPEEIARSWRQVVESNDFLSKMALAVKIRRGMEISQLETHVAYSAGETKSRAVMTGARAVVDILRASEVIKAEGDYAFPNTEIKTSVGEEEETSSNTETAAQPRAYKYRATEGPVNVSIAVQLSVTPSDLDGLGKKLRQLLDDLQREPIANETEE